MILASLFVLTACSTSSPPATPDASHEGTEHHDGDHHDGDHHDGEVVDESKPHHHDAPHGGIVQAVGDLHVEAMFMPEGVMFYVYGDGMKSIPLDGYGGSAVVKGPDGVQTVQLTPMGDHLHAAVKLTQGQPATAVLTVTKDGNAQSGSFETQTVGMQSHDHTSLHGGVVSMWGDYHLEYAPKDDEYRVWVTDEHRAAITGDVKGSLKDGETVVPLTFDTGTGMLSGKGAGAGSRPVMVSVSVGEKSFDLGFNAVQP
jgi:hypothetical protein